MDHGTVNLERTGKAPKPQRDEHGLLPKERFFADEYLLDLNGTAAAMRAGYSVRTASAIATQLLKRPRIKLYIERAKAERLRRLRLAQDEVVKELRLLVFSNHNHYRLTTAGRIELVDGSVDHNGQPVTEDVIRAVSKVKRKITTYVDPEDGTETTTQESELAVYDKNSAIKTYMAHLGIDGRALGKGEEDVEDNSLVFKEEDEGRRGDETDEPVDIDGDG